MEKLKDIKINNKFTAAPVLIFALTVLFSSLCFIFNVHNIIFSLIIAVIIVAAIGIKFDRTILISYIITIILLLLSIIIAGHVYDLSYDGMYFHKEAVYALANGWNPLKTSFMDFSHFGKLQDLSLWLDNYPKGVWSFYACIYSLGGKIECVKGANMIFVLMMFFTAYDTISTVFGKKGILCFFLAAVFTANPVIASQYFTCMNDLPVAAFIMICAFFGMKIYTEKTDNWDYICVAAVFASSFAVKFTAPILCGFTLAGFGIAVAIKNKGKNILKPCVVVIVAAAVGVCIMGADPYIKHLKEGKNPIYPVMGEGKYDIMNTNAPEGIDEMSNTGAMITSLFSQSAANPWDKPVIKMPFSIGENEINALGSPDTRLGGFGIFFSGIILISLVLGIFAIFKSKGAFSVIPPLIIFVLLALFFPESWWARYNPYIYYIPCLILLAFSCVDKTKIITMAMCVLILINSAVNGTMVLRNFYKETKAIEWRMNELAKSEKHILLNINDFPCHEMWFKENNLDYELVWDMDAEKREIFLRTTFYQLQDN